jgi:hypothetical protein
MAGSYLTIKVGAPYRPGSHPLPGACANVRIVHCTRRRREALSFLGVFGSASEAYCPAWLDPGGAFFASGVITRPAYSRMVDFGKVEEGGKADMARAVTKEMELASRQYWLRHDQVIAITNALCLQATAMELLNKKTQDGHLPAEIRRFADTLLKEWDDAPTWFGC